MNDFKYNGEDLTFYKNGDIIHKSHGKLGRNSTEVEAWCILLRNFQSSEKYPNIQILAREVWDKIPVPTLFGVEYKIDEKHIRMSPIVNLSEPYKEEKEFDIRTNTYGDTYIQVNTPKPFHFWNGESIDSVLNLINVHIEQERVRKEQKEVRRKQAQRDILNDLRELLKDNPYLVLKGGESWRESMIEVQFESQWVGEIDINDFSKVALPELYKLLY